ncbi:hypothetical protein ACFSRY_01455 [Pontibacter locisalis]|uniref:SpoIIAA-like n=1 Tax=Pontibacter locisalis TaxID=1719035 RepID=A0ABW5IGK2_9BACT
MIKYNEALSLLEIMWYGYITDDNIQEAIDNVAKVLTTRQVKFFVSDVRNSNTTRVTEEAWLLNYCFPLLEYNGIKRMARISDGCTLGQMVMGNIVDVMSKEEQYHFTVQSFAEREKAMDWLLNAQA